MRRCEISEKQWEKIKDKLPCQPGYQGRSVNNRLFFNAVMFVAKWDIPWRDLPERFGNWIHSTSDSNDGQRLAYGRIYSKDLADRIVKILPIDSTTMRVHRHVAGV